MKIQYQERKFYKKTLALIETINSVINEYQRQGYTLTLRQTYYQLVARGYIENSENSYERIGDTIDKARLAGLIDWEAITDRTRYLRASSHWTTPADIINSASYSYRLDKWAYQPNYIEVWIEKDALVDVVGKAKSHAKISVTLSYIVKQIFRPTSFSLGNSQIKLASFLNHMDLLDV